MKVKRHSPVAKGFSAGVQIIRKLRTAEQLLSQGPSLTSAEPWRYPQRPTTAGSSCTGECRRSRPEAMS